MKYVLDFSDVDKESWSKDYKGEMLVIKLDFFKPEYKEAKYQLFKAESGFGCEPGSLGTKIFGYFTDEDAMVRRTDVLGIATPEAIEQWESVYGKFGSENRRRVCV